MSLGFHVTPDAFAAKGDITAIRTQSEGNDLEHETSTGQYSSLVQVDSDPYALAHSGDGNVEWLQLPQHQTLLHRTQIQLL